MLRGKLQFYAFLTSWNHAFQNVVKAEECLVLRAQYACNWYFLDTRKSKDRAQSSLLNREHVNILIEPETQQVFKTRARSTEHVYVRDLSGVHMRDPANSGFGLLVLLFNFPTERLLFEKLQEAQEFLTNNHKTKSLMVRFMFQGCIQRCVKDVVLSQPTLSN